MKTVIIQQPGGITPAVLKCEEVRIDPVNGGWIDCMGISENFGLMSTPDISQQFPLSQVKGIW